MNDYANQKGVHSTTGTLIGRGYVLTRVVEAPFGTSIDLKSHGSIRISVCLVDFANSIHYHRFSLLLSAYSKKQWPSNNNKADLANLNNIEGRFVKSIKAQKNVITIMYGYDANPAIFHEKITFTATETNGNFS